MPQPFIKFYPRDWDADMQLLGCSLAARALWLHMIRVMSEADPFGFFVGRAGEPIDLTAFSRRICAEPRDVRKLIVELRTGGVFSTDSSDRIFSRRMVREHARREQLIANSGLPVVNTRETNLVDTRKPTLVDTATNGSQKPDTRDTSSLRSSALAFGSWPVGDIPRLRELATLFLAAFGNCRDPIKAEKHMGAYTTVLATFSSRQATIEQAWDACVDALEAAGGRPLFSSTIRTAIAFLKPARPSESTRSKTTQYLHDHGMTA
jgi:hypothetical protein